MSQQLTLPGLPLHSPDPSLSAAKDLRDWPDVSADVVCRHAKLLGAAGEAIFDAQMLMFGEIAAPVPESMPFDRILLRRPYSIRVQIKSVIMPSAHGYSIEPKKGYRGSPQGMRVYADDDYDMLAIIVLREGVIRFTTEKQRRFHIPLSAISQLRARPRLSFDAALQDLQARATAAPEAEPFPMFG